MKTTYAHRHETTGREAAIAGDGVHMTDLGNEALAAAVAARLREALNP